MSDTVLVVEAPAPAITVQVEVPGIRGPVGPVGPPGPEGPPGDAQEMPDLTLQFENKLI